jgi:hypothetical protein
MAMVTFVVTGIRPKCLEGLACSGISLPAELFLRNQIEL